MKNRQRLSIALVALFVVVVGLSVAYAALSQTLNITINNVAVSNLSWSIGISCSLTTSGGTSDTGRSCGTVSASGTSITIADSALSKPGDYCLYTCTVTNGGGINASLGSIAATVPTVQSGTESCSKSGATITCTNVKYQLCTAQSSGSCSTVLSTSNGGVNANSSKTIYLLMSYTSSSLSSGAVLTGAKYVLTYNQA